MAKYVYPAIFTKEAEGGYSVSFPDVKGCYTQGETLTEALEMAEDALGLMLCTYEDKKIEIAVPTDIHDIHVESNQTVSLVLCDTVKIRKEIDNRAVKKTLSIPQWLNTMAEERNINFSQILQKALKAELNI
ncbi:MAG: type II toxin-antitoxin system HicB family antitoxin [Clostridia bacterium]|nr:type II toxin-antitoxin system HicB family antitoxin [Clostridia bacterium]